MAASKVEALIHAAGVDISIVTTVGSEEDYISLTDIAKYHNPELPGYVIQNWLRNRSTIEFLGLWEQLNNPDFNCLEFEAIAIKANLIPPELPKQQKGFVYADEADVLNLALFGKTAKQWRAENPGTKGNMRDYATIEQLLVLTNLENINALLIDQGVSQQERLQKLRETVIYQIRTLTESKSARELNYMHNQLKLPTDE